MSFNPKNLYLYRDDGGSSGADGATTGEGRHFRDPRPHMCTVPPLSVDGRRHSRDPSWPSPHHPQPHLALRRRKGAIPGILHGRPCHPRPRPALCGWKGTTTWMPSPLRSSPLPYISPSIGDSLTPPRVVSPHLEIVTKTSVVSPPFRKSPSSLLHHLLVESHRRNDGYRLVAHHIVLGSEQRKVTRLLLPFGATLPPSPSPVAPPLPPPSHRLPSLRCPNGEIA